MELAFIGPPYFIKTRHFIEMDGRSPARLKTHYAGQNNLSWPALQWLIPRVALKERHKVKCKF
jgi:hypothetical protein